MLGAAVARRASKVGPVVLLEAAPALGGLTSTHRLPVGDESVEVDRFYHVILKGDRRVQHWLEELGLAEQLDFKAVGSTVVRDGEAFDASSFVQMAGLPFLSWVDRFRIGLSVGLGAVTPSGPWFSRVPAQRWLRWVAGGQAAERFWSPLLRAKLGPYAPRVSSEFLHSTFSRLLLARFQGGGADLFAVVPGGYGTILRAAAAQLDRLGVDTRVNARATGVRHTAEGVEVTYLDATGAPRTVLGRHVVVTTPAGVAASMIEELNPAVRDLLQRIQYLGVVNVTALLKRRPNPAYLTYIVDPDTLLTSVIGMHTLIPPEETGGRFLVHLPSYCAPDDALFDESDEEIVARFTAALRHVYPSVTPEDVEVAGVARARAVMPVPLVGGVPAPPADLGVPDVTFISAAQLEGGTLNVESTLELVEKHLPAHLGGTRSES